MSAEERRSPAASPAGTCGPRWRPRLEARWQAWVREVTELSLAYHVAAAASPDGTGGGVGQPDTQALLLRTVAARRKLADIEEALDRLAAGNFGSCEQCRSPNPVTQPGHAARRRPRGRYCPGCGAESARAGPRPAAACDDGAPVGLGRPLRRRDPQGRRPGRDPG
jgi:RNA polymerase-binding transcription factor DksA